MVFIDFLRLLSARAILPPTDLITIVCLFTRTVEAVLGYSSASDLSSRMACGLHVVFHFQQMLFAFTSTNPNIKTTLLFILYSRALFCVTKKETDCLYSHYSLLRVMEKNKLTKFKAVQESSTK